MHLNAERRRLSKNPGLHPHDHHEQTREKKIDEH